MNELYIGVMSGTSLDGIDIVLCDISSSKCDLVSSFESPFDEQLKDEILSVIMDRTTLEQIGIVDNKLGNLFADAINTFIKKEQIDTSKITAIGLHGQTLWHKPNGKNPFSMQLGDANIVAAKTNIQVVADFRRMDMAHGGQGAPLAPAFHQFVFSKLEKNVAILNIGGMANLTILGKSLSGWDIGAGNVLMDYWIKQSQNKAYDKGGEFAKQGNIDKNLLTSFLDDAYFKKIPPKSTGREYFNSSWLAEHLPILQTIKDKDIQRTLLELTAQSIANDIKKTATNLLIVCGGGAKNNFLMSRLKELCNIEVTKSDKYGISGDFMEAIAFAWLAYKRVHREKVNLSSVTGARKDSILGGIYG